MWKQGLVLGLLMAVATASAVAWNAPQQDTATPPASPDSANQDQESKAKGPQKVETATFGAGCFWCVEAIFQRLEGVASVESGYCNGKVPNPSYKDVCGGLTGHAEVCRIRYNPEVISFPELLEVFWKTHDPTTLNRQGADSGTQYRSAVFYHTDEQRKLAEEYKRKLDESGAFNSPIVTEITKAEKFYPAEDYHQNYFNQNSSQGYCRMVIVPKLEKFKKVFADKMKK